MKNNVIVILLVVFIGLVSGIGLLLGIGNVVNMAVVPIGAQVQHITSAQQTLHAQVQELAAKIKDLEERGVNPQAAAPSMPPSEDYNKVYDIPVGNTPIIGKKDAPHTIVEFTDLQCPFCNRFHPPIKEVLAQYPDDVNLVIKNYPLPFHPNARPAAKVALAAAAQGKYEEMITVLLENGADVSEEKLKEYSTKIGINADQLIADLKNNDAAYEAQIQADEQIAGQVDVRGTPTFFLDGKKSDNRSPEEWKRAIEALKK